MSAYGTEVTPTTTPETGYSPKLLSIAADWRSALEAKRFRTVRATIHSVRMRVALRIDAIKSRTTIDG